MRNFKITAILTLAAMLLTMVPAGLTFAANKPDPGIKTIGFIGDSITHSSTYRSSTYQAVTQEFLATRFPDQEIVTRNFGIAGDTVNDVDLRFDYDIKPDICDVNVIMIGMNDRNTPIDSYKASLDSVVKKIKALGKDVIIVGTSPTAAQTSWPTLTNIVNKAKEVAQENDAEFIDFLNPMMDILREDPSAPIILSDGIHPNDIGHSIMSYYFLQNYKSQVASVSLDASGLLFNAENCSVSNVTAANGGVSFTYQANVLPMGVTAAYTQAENYVPLTQDYNQEILQVKGLGSDEYIVSFGTEKVGTFTGTELNEGVNIATLAQNPGQAKAKAIHTKNQEKALKDMILRDIKYAERMYYKQGGSSYVYPWGSKDNATVKAWIENNYASASAYVQGIYKNYLDYKETEEQVKTERDNLAKELYTMNKTESYEVSIVPAVSDVQLVESTDPDDTVIYYTLSDNFSTSHPVKEYGQGTQAEDWLWSSWLCTDNDSPSIYTNKKDHSATYTLSGLEDATYNVYFYNLTPRDKAGFLNRMNANIRHNGKDSEAIDCSGFELPQQAAAGEWSLLGAFDFASSGDQSITLTAQGGSVARVADVKLVKLVESQEADTKPTATISEITGDMTAGSTLTGGHGYQDAENDPENGTTQKWFALNTVTNNWTQVGTGNTYTVTASDVYGARYIKYEVTPKNDKGTGYPVSKVIGPMERSDSNAAGTYTVNGKTINEFNERDGLPNFMNKLKNGQKDITVAYLGGSITNQAGYRVRSLNWLKKEYPNISFTGINAGVSGTGSELGVARVPTHVLQYNPDLVFVEFNVNGGNAQSMEGIVRSIWENNPNTDIIFVYTVNQAMATALQQGNEPGNAMNYEGVAEHYGIPSIKFYADVVRLMDEGTLVFKGATSDPAKFTFSNDGTHPIECGDQLYADSIARSFTKMAEKTYASAPHTLAAPKYEDNWSDANMYDSLDSRLSYSGNGWKTATSNSDLPGDDVTKNNYQLEQYFDQLVWTENTADTLSFKFHGRKVGVFDFGGPDSGRIKVTYQKLSDNSVVKEQVLDRFTSYNNYYRHEFNYTDSVPEDDYLVTIQLVDTPRSGSSLKENMISDKTLITSRPELFQPERFFFGKLLMLGEILDSGYEPQPSVSPSVEPSTAPSASPSVSPSAVPSTSPSAGTNTPTPTPTYYPQPTYYPGVPSGPGVVIPGTGNDKRTCKFTDISGHYAQSQIKKLYEDNILNGITDTEFGPNETVSRAQFAAMIKRALELNSVLYSGQYGDVSSNDWFASDVATITKAGIMAGDDLGNFRPNDQISREEMAKVLVNAYKLKTSTAVSGNNASSVFGDSGSISGWAKEYVDAAVSLNLLSGFEDNTIRPQDIATRAQAATVIYRLIYEK